MAWDSSWDEAFVSVLDEICAKGHYGIRKSQMWSDEFWRRFAFRFGQNIANHQITSEQCQERGMLLRNVNRTYEHPEADRDPDILYVKMNNVFKKKIVPRFPLSKKRTSNGSSSSMKSSFKSGFSRMKSHDTMSFEDITGRVTSEIDKLISAGHINRSYGYKVASLYSKMIRDDLIVNVQLFCTVALRDSVDKVL